MEENKRLKEQVKELEDAIIGYQRQVHTLAKAIEELEGIKPLTDEEIKELANKYSEPYPQFIHARDHYHGFKAGYKACQERILQIKQRT